MDYDTTKLVKLAALKALAEKVASDYATKTELAAIDERIDDIVSTGGEPNVITTVKVNGTALAVTDKAVDVTVPTAVSELDNDSGYQSASEVSSAVDAALDAFAAEVSDDGVVNTYKELIDYAAEHSAETVTMAGDIATLKKEVANKVDAETGKGLSTEDYTTEEKEKLAGIDAATDEEVTEMLNEVFAAA